MLERVLRALNLMREEVTIYRGTPIQSRPHTRVTADTLVKTGPGRLIRVILGEVATSGDVIFYDNTSEVAPIIYSMNLHKDFHQLHASSIECGIDFSTGLYVGFDGTVVADMTIIYA